MESEYEDASTTESIVSKGMESSTGHDSDVTIKDEPANEWIVCLKKQNEEAPYKNKFFEDFIRSLKATIAIR